MLTAPRTWRALLLASVLVILGGCGKKGLDTVRVTGTVKLDGKPMAGASVLFSPKAGGRPASATTDESGSFSLTTLTPNDGALVGEHAVGVTLIQTKGATGDPNAPGLSGSLNAAPASVQWIIPQKYANPTSSGLTVTVQSGMAPVVLDLRSK